jgi:alkylation response protein AidB-like acyl-CoA dehydrogenase
MGDGTENLVAESAFAFGRRFGGAERARVRRNAQEVPNLWPEISALGWPGLLVPEEKGGSGLLGRDLLALSEALGPSLLIEPVIPAMAAAALLSGFEAADSILSDVLGGQHPVALALPPAGETGAAPVFHDGQDAELIVVARGDDIRLVRRDATGVAIERSVDGGSFGRIAPPVLAHATLLGEGPAVTAAAEFATDILALGTAGLLLGLAGRALDLTLDHLRTRRQFGRPIGAFQALQHRAATLHVALASSRAFLMEAAGCFETPNRRWAAASARARSSETAILVAKEAVQMHGAIGFADEHEIGLILRRVLALGCSYGTAAPWRRRAAESASREASHASRASVVSDHLCGDAAT